MRSLLSPRQAAVSQASGTTPVSARGVPSTSPPAAPASSASSSVVPPSPTPEPFTPLVPSLSASPQDRLVEENEKLQDQVCQLQNQVRSILDHTIQSDLRLLEYTNEVFVVNTPRAGSPVTPQPGQTTVQPTTADSAVQCEAPSTCQSDACAEDRALILRLKTTIEVLEAEIESLRVDLRSCDCRDRCGEWTVQANRKHSPIALKNKFNGLHTEVENDSVRSLDSTTALKKPRRRAKKKENNANKRMPTRNKCRFRSVHIEADSHGRHLAGMVRELVPAGTTVTSVVKPGARLLSVVSSTPLPADSCSLIVAGTNDLAAGGEADIYRHLEERVVAKLEYSKVLVATLPHRHDLPTRHPINRQTGLVNRHIKMIADKYNGVELVNFNSIGRSLFTGHGMHLRLPGKRVLARMVVESLHKMGDYSGGVSSPAARSLTLVTSSQTTRSSPFASAGSIHVDGMGPTRSTEPVTLPYNSYAEALLQPPSPKSLPAASLPQFDSLSPLFLQQ